jgi:RNA polymerase sigma factor (sigma-70 family)
VNCLPDAEQELWLVVSKDPHRFTSLDDARIELLNLASNIAKRVRREEQRDRLHHDRTFEPERLRDQADSPLEILQACQLLDVIDELEDRLRTVFINYRILGFNTRELAKMLGIDETTVSDRALSAAAEIQKKLARKAAKDRRKLGVFIAPTTLEIKPEFRAAFCAIWETEGRLPGGSKNPPPLPPPWWFVSVVPAMQTAAETVVSSARLVVLTILLLFVPVSLFALYYVWDPARSNTARAGLQVPPTPEIGEINDIVDAYPAAQAPAAPSARASTPAALKASFHALDEDALHELDGPSLTRSGSGSE